MSPDASAVGPRVDGAPARCPARVVLEGRYARLVPLDAALHGDALYDATHGPANEHVWAYLSDGPFPTRADFDAALAKKATATDAMYLMARHAFEDLGYRRYEWKCNALNEPSKRAAVRLGFTCEGVFRQHMIIKGRNRDTAWYSMLDTEWPAVKARFERWLDASNVDASGRQR